MTATASCVAVCALAVAIIAPLAALLGWSLSKHARRRARHGQGGAFSEKSHRGSSEACAGDREPPVSYPALWDDLDICTGNSGAGDGDSGDPAAGGNCDG